MNQGSIHINVREDEEALYFLTNWIPEYKESLIRYADNPNIAKYLACRFPSPYTEEDALWYLNYAQTTEDERLMAIVRQDKSTGVIEAIGSIGFSFYKGEREHSGEFGYWLGEKFWGKKLMTAVAKTFLDECIEPYRHQHKPVTLSKLTAVVYTPNTGSVRVLEKNGFEIEAKLKRYAWKDGQYYDAYILSRFYDD
ncbi:hypothetical protein THRCLA_04703 [Thraustotheca clavata]|uniref:N-acetyltransferase domain-containing protein n=1 Tax=Thraustotheca clavata TaxID=74557 RepID=A0A1V9ZY90_9STRA|nr:hypothetical protein THRCLA_04703 [Thraustotheca clavata]